MKKALLTLTLSVFAVLPARAALSVPLTIQEALYPGDFTGHTYSAPGGIARTNEAWCAGIPIADSAGLTGTSSLTLANATAGQFSVIERWPDGNVKWVKVCGVTPNVSSGSTVSDTLSDSGSGNFGTLAAMTSVSGRTITINTTGGACGSGSTVCFTMTGTAAQPGGFNGIDTATVGSTTLVGSGTSSGFVVTGPANPNTDCGTSTACTTLYESVNDTGSVCTVSNDGPVEAMVTCNYALKDSSGNQYLTGTSYFYFHNGSSKVRVVSVLKNAAYGTSNTFATAYKAMQAYEFRMGSNLGVSPLNWNIGNHTGIATPTTGTMSGTDSVYIYQGQNTTFGDNNWSNCGSPCTAYTLDQGYSISKNGASQLTGTLSQAPVGYADLSNTANAGIQIGQFFMAGLGPKSLEFQSGGNGTDAVRLGLFAAENSFPVYLAWPQWKTDEFYLYFRNSAPASVPNEFLKEQEPLIARSTYTQYNDSGVFFYPLSSPTEEDQFYYNTVTAASPAVSTTSGCAGGASYATLGCIFDVGTQTPSQWPLFMYPDAGYMYSQGGGRDQVDWRYSYLMNWLTRGHTGRYLQTRQFMMMQGDTVNSHADFNGGWRSKPLTQIDTTGRPNAQSFQPKGTCNVAADGKSVTLVSGAYFGPWWFDGGNGSMMTINGSAYPIASVTSTTAISTTSAVAGAPLTGVSCGLQTPIGNMILRSWGLGQPDPEHTQWWGIETYYELSGEQWVYDALRNEFDDYHLNLNTYQGAAAAGPNLGIGTGNTSGTTLTVTSGSMPSYAIGYTVLIGGPTSSTLTNFLPYTVTAIAGTSVTISPSAPAISGANWVMLGGIGGSRAIGLAMTNAARYAQFLAGNGDPADAAIALQQAKNVFASQVKPPLCLSGSPNACTFGNVNNGAWTSSGTSTTRGANYYAYNVGVGNPACQPTYPDVRAQSPFQESILQQGLWELRSVAGPGWSDYTNSFDLLSAGFMWNMTEGANYDGTSSWSNNGFRYYVMLDIPNCPSDTTFYPVRSNQTVWMPFFFSQQYYGGPTYNPAIPNWLPFFKDSLQRVMSSNPVGAGTGGHMMDVGGYQLEALIYELNHAPNNSLQTVPISSAVSNGGGSYTLSWTVPSSAQSYRMKWGTKQIVDWIGFNPVTNAFTGDPVNSMNWFAANEVTSVPAPAAAGSTQSVTINTGVTGLTAANFSLKVMTGSAVVQPPNPTPTTLLMVSGNGQTAAPSAALSGPLTVEVVDGSGNPMSGVPVTFSVASGGGSLSATAATTNAQGMATTTLTLGGAPGTNTVTVASGTLAGSPLTFTATASSTASNLVLVTGNNQSGSTGSALLTPLTVQVNNSAGSPVAGVTVTFTVTAGGGTLSTLQGVTNAQGQVSASLTLGALAGTNTVTAASGGLTGSPITFTATATTASTGTGGITWSQAKVTPGWPTSNGYMYMNWDFVSGRTIIFGHRGFSGTANVTKGSNIVTWASGDKFGDYWQTTDRVILGSGTYNITVPPTGAAAPPSTNNKTQLTLTQNYTGPSGTVSFSAGETAIYSNDVIFYNAANNTWSWGPGTGAQQDLCIVDTPTMPGQRHPIGQMAIDTRRGFLWLTGGVNQSCTITPVVTNGTTTVTTTPGQFTMGTNWNGVTACIGLSGAACTKYTVDHVVDANTVVMTTPIPAGSTFFRIQAPEHKNPALPNSKYDTYYLTLNPDPTTDAWTQVPTAAHVPDAIVESVMTYDPDDDVIILFGYDQGGDSKDMWAYCSTIGNTGGVLTAQQKAAGCVNPDDWTQVTTQCVGAQCIRNHPPGSTYPGMVWDTATHTILQYGGTQGYLGTPQNVIFSYNVAQHTWTQKTSIGVPPPIIQTGSCCLQSLPTIAYDTKIQKLFFHYLGNGVSADYMYDPAADQWTSVGSPSTGVGATATNGASGQMATYDAANNVIVGWNEGGPANLWVGAISSQIGSSGSNSCDLNSDGLVNSADVQLAVNQTVNLTPCSSLALVGNGSCTIIGVQRVVLASLGAACVTGQ